LQVSQGSEPGQELSGLKQISGIESLLEKISHPVIRPGLSRVAKLLSRMGHPERTFPSVHVVGTNGKGSIAAMLESIFLEAGYTTCMYTSPHLMGITERLRFSGAPVAPETLFLSLEKAGRLLEYEMDPDEKPTYFEVLTAAAFDAIGSYSPDIAIIEAGMGGRLDATNILGNVLITVISSIGPDHSQYLGGSIIEIAMEKFQVLRPGGASVFSGNPPELEETYRKYCKKIGNRGLLASSSTSLRDLRIGEEGNEFEISIEGGAFFQARSRLGGVYQFENASTALLAAHVLSRSYVSISKNSMIRGIANASWPGRMERFSLDGKQVILDGAHNLPGIKAVIDTIEALGARSEHAVVFTSMKDKDTDRMVESLCRAFPMVVFTSIPGMERCVDPLLLLGKAKELPTECDLSVVHDPFTALLRAMGKYDKVICCGSLFLAGEIRKRLLEVSVGQDQ